ncbi:MAG TPA: gfo/Idh/MocA family oxidoreductase, partial [Agriterribacter sp.]|nr:gfo/Idh/MocA family oxidoreductase [Agriterribacter sp.]
MEKKYDRRSFINTAIAGSAGLGLSGSLSALYAAGRAQQKRIGIIGLDTSHSIAFTKALNAAGTAPELEGYRVVAAYPKGSNDIESSVKRIPGYTEEIK